MRASQRREQVLGVAEEEFAVTGLHGTSTETIARRAGISQAYVFRIFGTKKQLFVEVVDGAFERMSVAMLAASGGLSGIEALAAMGQEYDAMLADRTTLLLQLHGVAASNDPEVRDAVRASFGRLLACRGRHRRARPGDREDVSGLRDAAQHQRRPRPGRS